MNFKSAWNKTVEKTSQMNPKETLDGVVDKTGNLVDKSMEKAVKITTDERLPGFVTKAVEKATQPKSTKEILVTGAFGAGVALVFGGAVVPVVAGAVIEGVVTKKLIDKYVEKKNEANSNKSTASKPAAKKKPGTGKGGTKPGKI